MGLEKEKCRDVRMTRDTKGHHKVFIWHVIVLFSLNSSYCQELTAKLKKHSEFSLGSLKENSRRANFLSKKWAKLSVDMNCSSKIHINSNNRQRENLLNFLQTFEINNTLAFFCRKAQNLRIALSLLLHNTIPGLQIGGRKKVNFHWIFRDKFADKLADCVGNLQEF